MVSPRELRPGSRIIGNGPRLETVKEILDNTLVGKVNQKPGYSHLITVEECGNQYKPIELTPCPITYGRLLKMGFKALGSKGLCCSLHVNTNMELFYHVDMGLRLQTESSGCAFQLPPTLYFVHTLQELYTLHSAGKELIIDTNDFLTS